MKKGAPGDAGAGPGVEDEAGPYGGRSWPGGATCAGGAGRGMDRETNQAQRRAWPGHRAAGETLARIRTHPSRRKAGTMVESLILAQDQRWRRA